jgi:hypothetical protein
MDCECILNLVHVPVYGTVKRRCYAITAGRRKITCTSSTPAPGYLPIIALTAKWEQASAESIVAQDLAM